MPAPPLSHHEIIALVEPFSRRGQHVDLAASDRAARQLAFKPTAAVDIAAVEQTLLLDCRNPDALRLTRRLRRADGLQATLHLHGPDPGLLLAQMEGVPPQRHFGEGAGFALARNYLLTGHADGSVAEPVLDSARLVLNGLVLTLSLPPDRGMAADLRLEAPHGLEAPLPEDLLAVLGWNWTRLIPDRHSWSSKLRLPRGPARRTRAAEAALDRAAAHLALTLAETPARFHHRQRRARQAVFLRRGIPAFTALAMLLGVAVVAYTTHYDVGDRPGLWFMLFHLPTAVFALSFCLQELPRLELPPWPRPLEAPRWAPAGAAGQAG